MNFLRTLPTDPARWFLRRMKLSPVLLAAAFAAACGGSGDADSSNCGVPGQCTMTAVSNASNVSNVTNNPTEDPTGAGTGTDSGDPPACEACGADQVCISGQCTDVPDQCPCPVETYCDLVAGKCVIGCTSDAECDKGRICDPVKRECAPGCREDTECGAGQICEGLVCVAGCRTDATCGPGEICDALACRQGCNTNDECPSGQICDATVCREGCTADAECKTAGDICDPVKKVCRAGCHVDEDCPLEKLCSVQLNCVAGCDGDSKCSAGKICTGGQCVSGCNSDAGCPNGQVCDAQKCISGCKSQDGCGLGKYCFEKQCILGCGPPEGDAVEADPSRCPVGQACYADFCDQFEQNCFEFKCQVECSYASECHSTDKQIYDCIGKEPDGYCMKRCTVNSNCEVGKSCALQAIPNEAIHEDVGYCRDNCESSNDCKGMWWNAKYTDCTCKGSGEFVGTCTMIENNVETECQHRYGAP